MAIIRVLLIKNIAIYAPRTEECCSIMHTENINYLFNHLLFCDFKETSTQNMILYTTVGNKPISTWSKTKYFFIIIVF